MRSITIHVLLATVAMTATTAMTAAPARAQQPPPAGPADGDTIPSVALPPELDRVLRDYERAWGARDAAGLATLFAEDGFVLQGGRMPVRGRAAIRDAYQGAGGPLRLRAFAFATAGEVGYILGGYTYPEASGEVGKFTLTLRRERGSGRWLIMSDMDNQNRRPSPRPTPG